MRVAEGSRCADNERFVSTLTTQIPSAQRAPIDEAELLAVVSIENEGAAHIRVFDRVLSAEAGARDLALASRDCDDVADAVALVLGVLVEAGRGSLGTALAPKPPSTPLPPPQPLEPEPAAPARKSPPPRPIRHAWLGPRAGHDLLAAAGVGFGLLPSPALTVTAGWGIRPATTWPIWLQGTTWLTQESDDRHGTFRAVYGEVLTCPLSARWTRFRLRACPGLAVGALMAAGRGLPESQKYTQVLPMVGLEVGASLKLVGPLALTLLARGDAPLVRPRFYYYRLNGDVPELHQPTWVVGSLLLGLGLHFR